MKTLLKIWDEDWGEVAKEIIDYEKVEVYNGLL